MDQEILLENSSPSWIHGGDVIARQLKEEGVKYIFTLTGGHISGIFDGARFNEIKLIDFRHEQAAVHAAEAYARLTRSVGVAALTAGPGITNGLTGIANAYYANSPIAVLGGRNPFAMGISGNLQDAPQLELTKPITKYSNAIYDNWRSTHIIREAFSSALSPRFGPVYIDIPFDVQLTRMSTELAPDVRKVTRPHIAGPDPGICKQLKKILEKSNKPLVIAGSGMYWSEGDGSLDRFLRKFKMPAILNGMSRGLLGRDHPCQLMRDRSKALKEAKTILLLGVDLDFRFNYGQGFAINPSAVIIQVDPEPGTIGKFRDVDMAIACDISKFLEEMSGTGNTTNKTNKSIWLAGLKKTDQESELHWNKAKQLPDSPIDPRRFVYEIAAALEEDTIVIGDGGDIVALFAEHFKPGKPGHWMDPGPFGCIGIGIPFAMGARLACPEKPIVVISGDGAFGFNAMEIEAASRQGLPFVVIIGNDGAWGEMRTFHEDIFGPYDPSAQYLSQGTRYEEMAIALGGYGERVEKASEIGPAMKRAFAAGVPAVINVILDPKFRRDAKTISGRNLVMAYSDGDPDAYKREHYNQSKKMKV